MSAVQQRQCVIVRGRDVTHANLFHYLSYLRFKSHVKHAVCFIQHQVGATTQISLPTFQEINKTPWSSNANLHACKPEEKTLIQEELMD